MTLLKCCTGSHVTFELDDTDEIAGAIDAECIRDADDLQQRYNATLGRSSLRSVDLVVPVPGSPYGQWP